MPTACSTAVKLNLFCITSLSSLALTCSSKGAAAQSSSLNILSETKLSSSKQMRGLSMIQCLKAAFMETDLCFCFLMEVS